MAGVGTLSTAGLAIDEFRDNAVFVYLQQSFGRKSQPSGHESDTDAEHV